MNTQVTSLLDRYVYAIRKLLPRDQRNDIASELREILQSQVDDEEARVQRPLRDDEIEVILKRFGRPREVASRYGSRQYLIGPEVFGSYVMAVKIVIRFMVPVTLFMVLLTGATAREHLLGSLLETVWTSVSIALVNLSIVTVMFVCFGRTSSKHVHDDWDPAALPEVPAGPGAPLSRSELVGSIAGLILVLCWWLGVNSLLQRWIGWEPMPIVWSSVWSDVTVAAVLVLIAGIGREVFGLICPRWIRAYLLSGCVLDLSAFLVLMRLLRSGSYVRVASAELPSTANMFASLLNFMIFAGLIAMSLIVVSSGIRTGVRFRRVSRLMSETTARAV